LRIGKSVSPATIKAGMAVKAANHTAIRMSDTPQTPR
jgi:hypothetical protein